MGPLQVFFLVTSSPLGHHFFHFPEITLGPRPLLLLFVRLVSFFWRIVSPVHCEVRPLGTLISFVFFLFGPFFFHFGVALPTSIFRHGPF